MIPDIPYVGGENIPFIQVNGTGVKLIQTIKPTNATIRPIGVSYISDARVWMIEPPQAIPPTVPVTVLAGTPIVNMPGCVKVHKENVKQRSKNKMLVNDDPKGNTVLCDAGAPYYQPVDYQSQGLTWTTVVPEEPEPDGIDSEPPPAPDITPPPTPDIPPQTVAEEKECPGPKDLRVGDYSTSGDEKVVGHEWNADQTICIVQWEPVGVVEKYLPSANVVTTTATIAVVATSSALLAKPLADLLLKVIKPLVKKISAKVKKVLGKTDPVLSVSERRAEQRDRNQAIQTLKKALKAKK